MYVGNIQGNACLGQNGAASNSCSLPPDHWYRNGHWSVGCLVSVTIELCIYWNAHEPALGEGPFGALIGGGA